MFILFPWFLYVSLSLETKYAADYQRVFYFAGYSISEKARMGEIVLNNILSLSPPTLVIYYFLSSHKIFPIPVVAHNNKKENTTQWRRLRNNITAVACFAAQSNCGFYWGSRRCLYSFRHKSIQLLYLFWLGLVVVAAVTVLHSPALNFLFL